MHRTPLIPLFLCATLIGHAQSSGTIKPVPDWKAGNRRQVSVNSTIRMTLDSATFTVTAQSSYLLEVLVARKDGYVLGISTRSTDDLEKKLELTDLVNGTTPDGLKQFKQTAAEDLYKSLGGLQTRFGITLAGEVTGQVDAIVTVEKLRPEMGPAITDMMGTIARYKSQQPRPIPQARMDYLTDSLYIILTKLQVHELNYLMRTYGTTFPLNGSQRERVAVKDVRTPLYQEYPKLSAIVEAGLDRYDAKEMTCRTITTYDPDSLYAGMAQDEWTPKVRPDNMSMVEERVVDFDRSHGWPTASTSETEFHCGPLKMHLTLKTALEAVR